MKKSSFYNRISEIEDTHWWYVARRQILKKVLLKYINTDRNISILEVGCGSGGNLSLFSTYGKIYAFELDDQARVMANNRGIVKVEKGFLPYNIPFGKKQFDLIAMLDVLEHIDDEKASLSSIFNRIRNNGYILLTVPAYNFLWSKLDIINNHKRRYLLSKIEKLILQSGFSIVYKTYFNTILFPIIAGTRIAENILNREFDRFTMMSPKKNTILSKIFSLEQAIIPKISIPYGGSILVIAKKTNK